MAGDNNRVGNETTSVDRLTQNTSVLRERSTGDEVEGGCNSTADQLKRSKTELSREEVEETPRDNITLGIREQNPNPAPVREKETDKTEKRENRNGKREDRSRDKKYKNKTPNHWRNPLGDL
ncbi:hypothetical protein KQX54_020744 [Cotesia glomerata]|uniref:Uncharacterized protein n=1 Tax=Cotesia glomerata TaxID=32391 RepID=A0AAV7IEU1_COTGL|nr:hypothetical protein KQX54_020744 [Cotesia glomerata]